MHVGIEITPVTLRPTGVGHYTKLLVKHLFAYSSQVSFQGFATGIRRIDLKAIPFPVVHLPVPTRAMYRLWELTGYPYVDRLLGGVDVFHAVNYVLPPLTSAKGVLTIHDLGFLHHPEWFPPKIIKPFQRMIAQSAQRADLIIAVSQATKEEIVSLLGIPPSRVRVVYEAADDYLAPIPYDKAIEETKRYLSVSPPYFLYVGTIEARKNVVGLLHAFSTLQLPHRLVLVGGPGWRYQEVAQTVTQLKLQHKVLFTGYLPQRSLMLALYGAADALILPSFHEGFGLPALEAMACGCPVILSNCSALPEVGGEAALYVDPYDPTSIAAALQAIAHDEALQHSLRTKGYMQVRQFSWEKCAAETLECYRGLCR